MSYSVLLAMRSQPAADGLHTIRIQLIYKSFKAYKSTLVKVKPNQFKDGRVVAHPDRFNYNEILEREMRLAKDKLLEAIRNGVEINNQVLGQIARGESLRPPSLDLCSFIDELVVELSASLAPGRLVHYNVINGKIHAYAPHTQIGNITHQWIMGFETHLRRTGISTNTIIGNMKVLKAVITRAMKREVITKDPFLNYPMPKKTHTEATYLTVDELERFQSVVEGVGVPGMKTAGMFFLLSCYFGYRLSDSLSFDPAKHIIDGIVTLRAKKNGRVVSFPIYPRSQKVIDFMLTNPKPLSEQRTRDYVKDISKLAGIKKHVKFHTSRHTFATLLLSNKVEMAVVSELLGDTVDVAKTYTHLTNDTIHKAVLDKMG